ncbi:MAG TPA: FliM/FliN family flagellar motor switch protein [Microvirga sp.]|nr:FliM/FliN family flagellar motor switch protein [Microvirga sp.]
MVALEKVVVELSVVLGTTVMPVHQLLRMGRGAVIELNATEEDDVAILANEVPVAKGQVIVQGDRIAVSITEILRRSVELR